MGLEVIRWELHTKSRSTNEDTNYLRGWKIGSNECKEISN